MMRKIAIGLVAAALVTGASTLSASAIPGGGRADLAIHGGGDGGGGAYVDVVRFGGGGFGRAASAGAASAGASGSTAVDLDLATATLGSAVDSDAATLGSAVDSVMDLGRGRGDFDSDAATSGSAVDSVMDLVADRGLPLTSTSMQLAGSGCQREPASASGPGPTVGLSSFPARCGQ